MATEEEKSKSVEIDNLTERKFVLFFADLVAEDKEDAPVRLFRCKEFYSVHGDDALFVAQEYYKTLATVKYYKLPSGNERLPTVYTSQTMYETVVRDLLLNQQRRVEVWEPQGNKWECVNKASPGNVEGFEDILFSNTEMKENAIFMSINLGSEGGERKIGVSFVDTTLRKMGVCEFVDNDKLSNLEAMMVQVGAKECLFVPGNEPDSKTVENVLEKGEVMLYRGKKKDFTTTNTEQDLKRLLGGIEPAVNSLDQTIGMASLAALVTHLELLSDPTNYGQYQFIPFDLSKYMRIDTAASQALNLFPKANQGSKAMSLFTLLNKCRTAMGSRLLQQWIKQPLLDQDEIERRLDTVSLFVEDTSSRQAMFDIHLRKVPDLDRLAKRFQKKKAKLEDCVKMYQFVLGLPDLAISIEDTENEDEEKKKRLQTDYAEPLKQAIADFGNFVRMIETTIDLDKVQEHQYLINPAFSPELQELRKDSDKLERKIHRIASEAADELGFEYGKQLKIEQHKDYGHVLRVTRKDEKALRGRREYTTLGARSGGVLFTNKSLTSVSEELKDTLSSYNSLQKELVEKAIEIVATYTPVLQDVKAVIASLDVLVAFAQTAVSAPKQYTRPLFSPAGDGDLELLGSRHACMEVLDDMDFISNDVVMKRDSSSFLLITGPNMGGKSTYIRQVGVTTLMAQIGCYVPCESATLPLTDAVLARVGAGDSQLRGVSTFMAEMLEISSILQSATSKSLLIIDELGRGTSTYDGFGLSWAISEHIANNVKAMTLFATHFHELTGLSNEIPTVKNYHVTALAEEGQLTLLYKVNPGSCDQSFGIHVAEMASFPSKVVEMAKRKADELEDFSTASGGKRVKLSNEEDPKIKEAINNALRKFKALPIANATPQEAQALIKEWRSELPPNILSLVA